MVAQAHTQLVIHFQIRIYLVHVRSTLGDVATLVVLLATIIVADCEGVT